jgi:hypothetical protein
MCKRIQGSLTSNSEPSSVGGIQMIMQIESIFEHLEANMKMC